MIIKNNILYMLLLVFLSKVFSIDSIKLLQNLIIDAKSLSDALTKDILKLENRF